MAERHPSVGSAPGSFHSAYVEVPKEVAAVRWGPLRLAPPSVAWSPAALPHPPRYRHRQRPSCAFAGAYWMCLPKGNKVLFCWTTLGACMRLPKQASAVEEVLGCPISSVIVWSVKKVGTCCLRARYLCDHRLANLHIPVWKRGNTREKLSDELTRSCSSHTSITR